MGCDESAQEKLQGKVPSVLVVAEQPDVAAQLIAHPAVQVRVGGEAELLALPDGIEGVEGVKSEHEACAEERHKRLRPGQDGVVHERERQEDGHQGHREVAGEREGPQADGHRKEEVRRVDAQSSKEGREQPWHKLGEERKRGGRGQ